MQEAANSSGPGDGAALPIPMARPQQLVAVDPRVQALANLARSAELESQEKEVDLLEYWRVIVKRRWAVLGVLLIAVLTGVISTLLTTPIFRATAVVQVDRQGQRIVNVQGVDYSESVFDREFYQTQYELLRSRTMSERVAADIDPDDPAFAMMGAPTPYQKLLELVLGKPEVSEEEQTAESKRRRIGWLIQSGLVIDPVPNSRLVRIHFDSPDPMISAKVANSVSEGFLRANMDRRVGTNEYAKEFLEDRLEQLKLRLEDSERALIDFAQREQIFNVGERTSLMSADLTALHSALTSAKQARIQAEAVWQQVQSGNNEALPDLINNPGVQNLRTARSKLHAEYQENLLTYKPGFPLMQQLQSQIAELDKQIAAEVDVVKRSMQANYRATVAHEAELERQVAMVKTDVLDLQGRSINYTILEREVETNRQLYDALLQRYKEIGITSSIDANNISIVDTALVPGGPYKPNMRRNVTMAAMVGLILGVLLAFVFEFLDDTLKRPDELEKHLGVPVLGVIPKLDGESPDEALADPRSAFSESYRSVRTSLQFATESGVPKCLLVTSPSAGEGKTTTALSLARHFAQLGRRVLLIDCDLRNPSLHRVLGSDNAVGLSNYLAGNINPAAAIRPTKTLRLTFIPSGPLPPNPAELLAGPKMMSMLALACEKFDQVIIDGPPVMGLADSPILSNLASGTLIVVEAGSTRIATAKAALKRLIGARAHIIGALLTKYDAKVAGYGYGGDYGGYHYYAYGGARPKSLTQG